MPSLKLPTLKICASIAVIAAVVSPVPGWCYTAVAYSKTNPDIAYVGKGPSRELAEQSAIATCDVDIRSAGEAPACRITVTTDNPGWYAVACGQLGCWAALGYKTLRAAQDAAFEGCYKQQKFCYSRLKAYGSDLYQPTERSTGAIK